MYRRETPKGASSPTPQRLHILTGGFLIGASAAIFPACGNIFTNPASYNFSPTQYGSLFVTQTLLAIASSLFSQRLHRNLGSVGLLRLAMVCCLLAMSLLAIIAATPHSPSLSYFLTVAANFFMGIGIGGGISIANVMATAAWSSHPTRGVAALHTMLGCGLASAPLGLSGLVALGHWWQMPLVIAAGAIALALSIRATEEVKTSKYTAAPYITPTDSHALVLLGSLAFLYGISEATFSNWCVIYLHDKSGVGVAAAGLALSGFWGTVTLGRFAFAASKPSVGGILALLSPLLMSVVFVLESQIKLPVVQVCGFVMAGLACAAVYPFLLGRASCLPTSLPQFVSGVMVATVLAGTGSGTYVTALLNRYAGLSLDQIYLVIAIVPLVIFVGLKSRTLSERKSTLN